MSDSVNKNAALTNRQLFFRHVAQTSPEPIGLEIARAEGIYQFDKTGKNTSILFRVLVFVILATATPK